MGGPGRPNTTTPEHLFAVGYAACFGGALDFVAVQKKKNAKGATVTCSVSIGPRDAGGFGIAVKLHVKDATLPQAELEALAREAHERTLVSHAFGRTRATTPAPGSRVSPPAPVGKGPTRTSKIYSSHLLSA
jgi:lipoyl-dependent peroxiredoxin